MTQTVYLGTEIKINISITPIDGVTMDDMDLDITFFCTPIKRVIYKKADAKRIDDSNYVFLLNSKDLGLGDIKAQIKAQIPDGDFKDRKRTEITVVDTNITIKKLDV